MLCFLLSLLTLISHALNHARDGMWIGADVAFCSLFIFVVFALASRCCVRCSQGELTRRPLAVPSWLVVLVFVFSVLVVVRHRLPAAALAAAILPRLQVAFH